eukprot:CAMPEP_0183703020 /NCGR_PEP_ID=MMETSP0737-20130205/922_1 /TAXON_ID=385413 /ORGANISM="Thalassiosira miniscula, Strain CCMP1093" /LENGTH=400 /DNA_ID=CAMNT_0025929717 /DNA_START=126 /DNA_END=1328 /DNA_ORIENTATION=+
MDRRISIASWNGGQGLPVTYGGDVRNDIDHQPTSNQSYDNYGSYSNFRQGEQNRRGIRILPENDESINYLAARAHAAQMLAAEESRRLEENLMRLEMRRRMMTSGGSGMGMDRGEQALSGNQLQLSNMSSSSILPKSDDCILMARAQKFNMPQSQSKMTDGSQTNCLNHCVGSDSAWNSAGNMNGLLSETNYLNLTEDQGDHTMLNSEKNVEIENIVKGSMGLKATRLCEATKKSPAFSPKNGKAINAPRRPLSAYNIFFSEMREVILDASGAGTGLEDECNKNSSGVEELGPVVSHANIERDSFPKDMQAFTQNLMKKRLNKKPIKRVHRKSHGKVSFTTLAKTVGQRWRELPEAQKKKYKDLAEIDRERYRNEKAAIGKVLREEAKKHRKESKVKKTL